MYFGWVYACRALTLYNLPMNQTGIWLALDYGKARIGVAIGQALTGNARPLTVVRCNAGEPDWHTLDQLIQEWRPNIIVIGRPAHADGTASAITKATERFSAALSTRYDVQIEMHDERLTSKVAEAQFAEARKQGRARAKDAKQLDALAACIILESWICEQQ